jgi:hypothetical protein
MLHHQGYHFRCFGPLYSSDASTNTHSRLCLFNLHVHMTLISPTPMKAPSKPTERLWHPSSLLPYDFPMIPNPEHDFDSITSEVKSTADTTTDLYDRSLTSRRYVLAGVVCTSIFSIGCIIAGTAIIATLQGNGAIQYLPNSNLPGEMLSLILNLIVALCTEFTGLVHSISL